MEKSKIWDEYGENVTRLLRKPRKGLSRLVFSRIGVVMLLLAVQVALLLMAYRWLDSYFDWFNGAQWVFTAFVVFSLFNSDMDATGKLTWMFLLALAPVPASIFLWFTQRSFGHRAQRRKVQEMVDATRGKLQQDEAVLQHTELMRSGTDDLCRYLNRSGTFPLYNNTEVTYYPSGEAKFAAMLDALKTAEKFIFLEYFIIDEGYMWGSVLNVLREKAEQGVDVRVMYDGMCEFTTLPADYPKRLARLGIQCKAFSPVYPFLSTHYNYRDHRKILVIDGKVAFNGGVNLADEYINKVERFGKWKDAAVKLTGGAVASFTLMFLQMWNLSEKDPRWDEYLPSPASAHDGYVMPYCDSPLDKDKVGEMVYMDMLNRARSYVHIFTPYLILDNELETALKFAAQRGVEVKLILPGIPDKKGAYALAKSHYKYLLEAGVQIYEYIPGFVHSKVFVCDGEKAVVGTINLDYRSLYHHFECATYLYRCGCITDIEKDFQMTLPECRQVTLENLKEVTRGYRLIGRITKIVAPLM